MNTIAYWRGFRHEWLREVLGFRLPHRISRLHSYLDPQERFHFAQSTGVDGNYMRPLGRYGVVETADVVAVRDECAFTWRDAIAPGRVPVARSVAETVHALALPGEGSVEVLLSGVALDTRCCDEHQPADNPCNSNGFWPVHVDVAVGTPAVEPSTWDFRSRGLGSAARRFAPARPTASLRSAASAASRKSGSKTAHVPIRVEIDRGWTPTRGGIPLIEEKPLNARLDFDLRIHLLLLQGDLHATRLDTSTEGSARRAAARSSHARIRGALDFESGFVGLHGFGFTFVKPPRPPRPVARAYDHLGRYLSALDFGVGAHRYDPGTGSVAVDDRQGVWIPRTVVGTDVRTRLGLSLVQLRRPATISTGDVEGSLCIHSSHQAPFFSHWKRTGTKVGPVRSEDVVRIAARSDLPSPS